jgi:hypothetical protein
MLSSLSESIRGFSESLREPDKDHLTAMCREVFDKFCEGCPAKEECRESLARGMDVVDSMTERLMKSGRIAPEKYGEIMRFGCPRKDGIVAELNSRAAKMLRERVRGDKRASSPSITMRRRASLQIPWRKATPSTPWTGS